MADSYHIINDQVVPYSGGSVHTDTSSWRDATEIELEQQARITVLETALDNLIGVASECDSWESFPTKALEDADAALSG